MNAGRLLIALLGAFVTGSGCADIGPSILTARGFDEDFHFMLMEVAGDALYFQAISRSGQTVDAGVISRPGT